jgi:hypothetical protein
MTEVTSQFQSSHKIEDPGFELGLITSVSPPYNDYNRLPDALLPTLIA